MLLWNLLDDNMSCAGLAFEAGELSCSGARGGIVR